MGILKRIIDRMKGHQEKERCGNSSRNMESAAEKAAEYIRESVGEARQQERDIKTEICADSAEELCGKLEQAGIHTEDAREIADKVANNWKKIHGEPMRRRGGRDGRI